MELLLNLAWLLLALPAYLLWRHGGPRAHRISRSQCLFTLCCALVILFPVVSATDDLRAMRAEMEECPAGKRSIRHSTTEKSSTSKGHGQAALAASSSHFFVSELGWHCAPSSCLPVLSPAAVERMGRAPPYSFLA